MKNWYIFVAVVICSLVAAGIYLTIQKRIDDFSSAFSSYSLEDQLFNIDVRTNNSVMLTDLDAQFMKTRDVVISTDGDYGVFIKYYPKLYNSGDWVFSGSSETILEYSFNEDRLFYGASLFKTPIAIAALLEIEKGNLDMKDTVTYLSSDYSDGTGDINQNKFGSTFTIEVIINKLLKKSDNTAQNILIRILGWTKISEVFDKIGTSPDFYTKNTTSPRNGVLVFESILSSNILTPVSGAYVLNTLDITDFDNRLDIGIDGSVVFSHKIGTDIGTFHDCGVATGTSGTAIVCLLSENTNQSDFTTVAQRVGEFTADLVNR